MAEKSDRIAEAFENALGELRQERLSAIGEAAAMHDALQSLVQHEMRRAEHKLGAEHARTQHLKALLQANARLVHALKLEGELSRIDVPEVAEEAALVHGRVADEDERGIGGLTVVLTDRSGTAARDTAEPATDASGYFAIPLEPETVDRLAKEHPRGIFVAVLTPRRRTVYRQPKPLVLGRGSRLFVDDVRLKRADLISVPSAPADTRTVSVPKLVGLTLQEATDRIARSGLKLGSVGGPSPAEDSVVARQEPGPESEVPLATPVNVGVRRPRAARGSGPRRPQSNGGRGSRG